MKSHLSTVLVLSIILFMIYLANTGKLANLKRIVSGIDYSQAGEAVGGITIPGVPPGIGKPGIPSRPNPDDYRPFPIPPDWHKWLPKGGSIK